MALNTVYLPKVDGLQTETSSINSDPRSLDNCIDVISNREDFLESRHGHPSAPKGSSTTGSAVDLFSYRNQTTKYFIPIYKESNKFKFKIISQAGDEITESSSESAAFREIDNVSTVRTSQVNLRPTAFAHDERLFFLTDYGLYFRPYSTPDASCSKVSFPLVRYIDIQPIWRSTSSTYATDIEAEANHWLVPGFQSNFRLAFEIEAKEGTKGTRRLISEPSRIYEIKNFNLSNTTTVNRTSNMLVTIPYLEISHIPAGFKVFLKIYRTKQFEIGQAPITEYFLAAPEIEITSSVISSSFSDTDNIDITVNDDVIATLEPLYNDTSQGGFSQTNHLPLPAKNVTQFRNYYVYSNLSLPPLTSIGLTKMPAHNDTLSIRLSGTDPSITKTHDLTFKTSGASPQSDIWINIPANATTLSNDYIAETSTDDLTYRGLRPSGQRLVDRVLRIKAGTSQGQVEPYGKLTNIQFINKKGNNAIVRATPDLSGFDINRFVAPGIAAVVNEDGDIYCLFSYSNIKRVSASLGFIDFEGSVSVGEPFPSAPSSSILQTYNWYLYYIPGENVQNLDIYKGTTTYFSLLPCKNSLPFPIAKPAPATDPVGTKPISFKYTNTDNIKQITEFSYMNSSKTATIKVADTTGITLNEYITVSCSDTRVDVYKGQVIAVTGTTISYKPDNPPTADINTTFVTGYVKEVSSTGAFTQEKFLINPNYIGLLTKPQGQLLDELAVAIADKFQGALNSGGAVIALNGGDRVENGVITAEVLDHRYEKIEFRRNNTTTSDIYEPTINTTYTELATSEKAISSFVISKENNPELIPFGGTADIAGPYQPPKVGDPNKPIVAIAATKDSIYLLKEDGVARVFIGFGALVPTIQGINVFDNTTFCVSAGSVQVLNDSVLFLAQNGVHSISGNNIDKVSRQIETELKRAVSECRNANKLDDIRSFSNGPKGLYGLYIPLFGSNYVTYVLNTATMRWTKWSNLINGAVVDQDGRLTTLTTDSSGNYIRQDRYTGGNPRGEVDQVDDEFSASSASDTGLVRTLTATGLGDKSYRFGTKQVYYKSGTNLYPVTVNRTGANTVDVTFTSTPPAFNELDKLVVGVNMMLQFQPFTAGNASVLKMFSGFHAHTEESVSDIKVSFKTEARSVYSVVKNFSSSPNNRTVYRCYIPLEAVRGRYLYRKIEHVRPYEICAIPAQAIIFRDTGSERVQKAQ